MGIREFGHALFFPNAITAIAVAISLAVCVSFNRHNALDGSLLFNHQAHVGVGEIENQKIAGPSFSDSGRILSFRCLAHFSQPNALASRQRHFSAREKLPKLSEVLTDSSSSHSLMSQQVKAAHQGQAPGANQVAPWNSTIRSPVLLAASSRVPTSAAALSINFRIASFLRTSWSSTLPPN